METDTTTLWHRVLHDPQLQDLPYKVETNEKGQIVLSPHKFRHAQQQSQIARLLDRHVKDVGASVVEAPVQTVHGVKVPDVVWLSDRRKEQIPDTAEASPIMPEICVEVLSGSNTGDEMTEKRALYLDAGAVEVWTCDREGTVRFFDASGEIGASALAPSFPSGVEV